MAEECGGVGAVEGSMIPAESEDANRPNLDIVATIGA
jgi:hypothetical protein